MQSTSQHHAPNAAADSVKALALFAVLQAVWSDVHPVCDQIVQRGTDAMKKGERSPDGRRARRTKLQVRKPKRKIEPPPEDPSSRPGGKA